MTVAEVAAAGAVALFVPLPYAIDDHQFYVTASGNTPKTATLWNYRGDTPAIRQHSNAAVDEAAIDVAEIIQICIDVKSKSVHRNVATSLNSNGANLSG